MIHDNRMLAEREFYCWKEACQGTQMGARMRTRKKMLCLLLSGILLATAGCGQQKGQAPSLQREAIDYTQGFLPAADSEGLTKIDENGRFILYADLSNGEMAIEDKQEGRTWHSNPVDKQEDGLASGFNKNMLLSVIAVKYTTEDRVPLQCGGYMSSVTKDGLTYRMEEDGSVIFFFDFPKEEFRIPIQYALREDGFSARVLADGIQEYGENKIDSIDLLPFFGAGGGEAEGYMLVPDGSGALIYYNNGKTAASTYQKALYGFDNGTSDKLYAEGEDIKAAVEYSQNQYLPVFGVHQNGGGFLAVITGEDARGSVSANVAGKYTSYNTVWSAYSYRFSGDMIWTEKDGTPKAVKFAEKSPEIWQDYEVSYLFLEDGRAEYADMAACYREYLIAEEGLVRRVKEQENIPLYLELYGYIEKVKPFLGIPMKTKITMTTVADAGEILDAAAAEGIENVILKYNYWMADSYYGKIPTHAKAEKKVGSKKELLQLQERLMQNGGGLYLSADLMNVYKLGNGVSKYKDVLRSVANAAQKQYVFKLDKPEFDSRYKIWYLLKPAALPEFCGRLVANMEKQGYCNLALDFIGEMCSSELGDGGMGRVQTAQVIADTVKDADENMDLLLTGANKYVAAYASHILQTPARSSGYDIEDVSVPFYQMVFHGYISYSLDATNLMSTPSDMTLLCMEYGAYPLYALVGENADELIGSRTDELYSADYRDWISFMGLQYGQINEVLGGVQASVVTEHHILPQQVRKVVYENGRMIYVNYGKSDAEADGIRIPAKGYCVVEDGKVLVSETVAAGAEGSGY